MAEPANDQAEFRLLDKEDGVWIEHREWGLVNLGPRDVACEEMARFLAEVDFGQ